jgi:phosphatidylglycerol---prolipoprotein diacylglyceryl transferase
VTPSIPYINIPPLHLFGPLTIDTGGGNFTIGELSIKPFGTLVALGVYLGTEITRRQGEKWKLDAKALSSFIFYILVGGFVGGHVLDTIFYHPDHLRESPLSLLRIWDGQSSFGGFTGAITGLLVWRHRFRSPTLVYADTVASAFPAAWVFGRMGCSVAHDHPGLRSDAWFAVAYPGGGRFDLGLYEMLLTIPLAVTFLLLMKKRRPPGFYLGGMCMAYAPSRFALDFLRVPEGELSGADLRYAGLTPAQWGCMALLFVGVYFAFLAARSVETGSDAPPDAIGPGSAEASASPGEAAPSAAPPAGAA